MTWANRVKKSLGKTQADEQVVTSSDDPQPRASQVEEDAQQGPSRLADMGVAPVKRVVGDGRVRSSVGDGTCDAEVSKTEGHATTNGSVPSGEDVLEPTRAPVNAWKSGKLKFGVG